MSTPAAQFRAKTNHMKSWRPLSPPSNRDRLELYALHKQAVSGDAPREDAASDASVADKAKLSAWRSKRGVSQSDAMQQYVSECERQIRVYGTRADGGDAGSTPMEAGNASGEGPASAPGSAPQTPCDSSTPQNTPAQLDDRDSDGDVLLCPRGLAAIPLLCAAASESRAAYLARLRVTSPGGGWWSKQEPLCLESGNPLSLPEKLILGLAEQVEKVSLLVGAYLGDGYDGSMSPRAIQAFLWPVHNIFLAVWILWILTCTYLGSVVMMSQTLLFGAKRTNTPLGRVFLEEINPSARAVESLCEQHQTIGVRVAGLVLMPLMMACDFSNSVANRAGILAGSVFFVSVGLCSWWYWICVLPWLAMCALSVAVMSGWCFSLIELSGN